MSNRSTTHRKSRGIAIAWLLAGVVGLGAAGWGLSLAPIFHRQHLPAFRQQHAALFAKADIVTLASAPVTFRISGVDSLSGILGFCRFDHITAGTEDPAAAAPDIRWAPDRERRWPDNITYTPRTAVLRVPPPLECILTFPPSGAGVPRAFTIEADVSVPRWATAGKLEVVTRRLVERSTVYIPTDPTETGVLTEFERKSAKQARVDSIGSWGVFGGAVGLILAWSGISGFLDAIGVIRIDKGGRIRRVQRGGKKRAKRP
jgi:hypothetical protein